MRWLHTVCFFALLPPVVISAGEPPVDQKGRPRIKKLGTIDVDKVENAPVVFRGKLYRCEWYRNKGCFHFVEHEHGTNHARVRSGLVLRQRLRRRRHGLRDRLPARPEGADVLSRRTWSIGILTPRSICQGTRSSIRRSARPETAT